VRVSQGLCFVLSMFSGDVKKKNTRNSLGNKLSIYPF
jgi:hypothetical protein